MQTFFKYFCNPAIRRGTEIEKERVREREIDNRKERKREGKREKG